MTFEVMMVKIQVEVFWVLTPRSVVFQRFILPPFSGLSEEDGGTEVLRNVGILPKHCTMSQPRRPQLGHSTTIYVPLYYFAVSKHMCL